MSSSSAIAMAGEEQVEPHLVDLAYRLGLPLVATNEPSSRRATTTRRMTR